MELTSTEQSAFKGLRERAAAINDEERRMCREIEGRLGLAKNAIGSSHTIDFASGAVVQIQASPVPPPAATAEGGVA